MLRETNSTRPATSSAASCPDNNGTLPSCAGLAVPYVPFQQNGVQSYTQTEALSNGTLFPGLNLPFHLKVEGSSLPNTPLAELQALEFVVLELRIYLDTHSDDSTPPWSGRPARPTSPNMAPSPMRPQPPGALTSGWLSRGPGTTHRMR